MEQPQHTIRAAYSESTITVYQAYSPEIGLPAARDGRFPAAWKRDRMTWVIKQRSQTVHLYVRGGPRLPAERPVEARIMIP
ncbi:DUF4291 family protein [Streptomyces sp. MBT62]|nr:DUF4291 family protein [Streptomyces sp. MBT62]